MQANNAASEHLEPCSETASSVQNFGLPREPNKGPASACLVIDGAYLQLGAAPLEQATNSRLNLADAASVAKIIDYV